MQSSWFSELFRLLVLPLQYELVREDTITILGYLNSRVLPRRGVIGDITTSAKRGSLVGIFGGGGIIILFVLLLWWKNHTDQP